MKKLISLALLAFSAAFSGCLSMESQGTLDAISGNLQQPFVEAFIEYPGPASKYSGPSNFILHIVAKDAGNAQIAVSPALFNKTERKRSLASAAATGEATRTRLSQLASALGAGDQIFHGCLYPVRVRLIRADQSLLEKVACRNATGWSRAASEAVDYFISASLK